MIMATDVLLVSGHRKRSSNSPSGRAVAADPPLPDELVAAACQVATQIVANGGRPTIGR